MITTPRTCPKCLVLNSIVDGICLWCGYNEAAAQDLDSDRRAREYMDQLFLNDVLNAEEPPTDEDVE
jgi:hypothetical protein